MPAFMKLGDIKGEATDRDHKDWIIIESMSWGVSRSSPGDGGPPGEKLQSFTVSKESDRATPLILEAACRGKVFPKVEFHSFPPTDEGASRYVKIQLWDCVVSSVAMAGRSDEASVDQISLSFEGAQIQVGASGGAVGQCQPSKEPGRR